LTTTYRFLVNQGSSCFYAAMSRLHRGLLNELVTEIVAGTSPSGDRLPPEGELARRFGVSRGVARECVRGLEERGLVHVRHGVGATVAPPSRWDVLDDDVLPALLRAPQRHAVTVEILHLQRLLEVEAARLGAERADASAHLQLRDALEDLQAAASSAAFSDALAALHAAIVHAAGQRMLTRVLVPLLGALADLEAAHLQRAGGAQAAVRALSRVVGAIVAADVPRAASTLDGYLGTLTVALAPASV
jgi:DNA-binding FadR family transcriptional regulator